MANIGKIEYRVRPVIRFVVTRYEESLNGTSAAGSTVKGEFENYESAYAVGYALAKNDRERYGFPVGSEMIQFPKQEDTIEALQERLGKILGELGYPGFTPETSNLSQVGQAEARNQCQAGNY